MEKKLSLKIAAVYTEDEIQPEAPYPQNVREINDDYNSPLRGSFISNSNSSSIISDASVQMKEDSDRIQILKPQDLLKLDYNVRWHWNTFLEFMFYHFIFFFVLGPLINIFLWWKPGKILLKNMGFQGFNLVNLVQTFIFCTNLYCSLQFLLADNQALIFTEMFYFWALILNLCMIISAKYATFSKNQVEILKKFTIDEDKKKLQYLYFHTAQSSEARYVELSAAFKRHQFDTSLFYISFFSLRNPTFVKSVEEMNQQLKQEHKGKRVYQPKPLIPCRHQFFGYGIANKLIQAYEESTPWRYQIIYSLLLSIAISLFPIIYNNSYDNVFSSNVGRMLYYLFMVIGEVYCGFICFIFLLTSLREFQKKKFLLIQCGFMISPVKATWDDEQQVPSVNITDIQSIMAWSMLRQIFLDYAKQYTLRTQAFYSIVIIYCFVVTCVIALHFTNIFRIATSTLIYMISIDFIFLLLIVQILICQAQINQFFEIYRNLIEGWKNIILDILRMEKHYFDSDLDIVPNNHLHKKIVKFIIEKVPQNIKSQTEKQNNQNYEEKKQASDLYLKSYDEVISNRDIFSTHKIQVSEEIFFQSLGNKAFQGSINNLQSSEEINAQSNIEIYTQKENSEFDYKLNELNKQIVYPSPQIQDQSVVIHNSQKQTKPSSEPAFFLNQTAQGQLNQINLSLKDALRHLKYDERNYSCRFYGFAVTFQKLWAIVVSLATVTALIVNYQIKK